MELFSFLLGLAIGLVALLLYRWRLLNRLHQTVACYKPKGRLPSFSLAGQLTHTLQQYQQLARQFEGEVEAWKQVINCAPIGYLQVDEENQLIWANPQALKFLRIQNFNPGGARLLLEWVRSHELDDLIEQARNTQKPCQQDWIFYPTSVDVMNVAVQATCPLRSYAFPMRNGQVGVILEDREEAVTLTQQRDRWTSDVAHELKTPLTSIRLVAETLQNRLETPLRTWVDRLLGEVMRLSTLVQEILDLSHLESPARMRSLRLTWIDVPQVIQSVWLSLEPIARGKEIPLQYSGPDRLEMQSDENRFHRVMLNLLDNAIKYTLPERPIYVQVSLQEGKTRSTTYDSAGMSGVTGSIVQIDIIDGGNGFPEDDLPFVFERFYRADPSRARFTLSRQPGNREMRSSGSSIADLRSNEAPLVRGIGHLRLGSEEGDLHDESQSTETVNETAVPTEPTPLQPSSGSGLGLAIVRQIVEWHQGSVTAQNHPQGGGWIQIRMPQRQS